MCLHYLLQMYREGYDTDLFPKGVELNRVLEMLGLATSAAVGDGKSTRT